jgi:uncharacterized NAD(P)/FAD-binding protein YdhS
MLENQQKKQTQEESWDETSLSNLKCPVSYLDGMIIPLHSITSDVTIIGGGYAGLEAARIINEINNKGLKVCQSLIIVDARKDIGGNAYGDLLNNFECKTFSGFIPLFSGLDEESLKKVIDFVESDRCHPLAREYFAQANYKDLPTPRPIVGILLASLIADSITESSPEINFTYGEVTTINRVKDSYLLNLDNGSSITTDKVVMAIGQARKPYLEGFNLDSPLFLDSYTLGTPKCVSEALKYKSICVIGSSASANDFALQLFSDVSKNSSLPSLTLLSSSGALNYLPIDINSKKVRNSELDGDIVLDNLNNILERISRFESVTAKEIAEAYEMDRLKSLNSEFRYFWKDFFKVIVGKMNEIFRALEETKNLDLIYDFCGKYGPNLWTKLGTINEEQFDKLNKFLAEGLVELGKCRVGSLKEVNSKVQVFGEDGRLFGTYDCVVDCTGLINQLSLARPIINSALRAVGYSSSEIENMPKLPLNENLELIGPCGLGGIYFASPDIYGNKVNCSYAYRPFSAGRIHKVVKTVVDGLADKLKETSE